MTDKFKKLKAMLKAYLAACIAAAASITLAATPVPGVEVTSPEVTGQPTVTVLPDGRTQWTWASSPVLVPAPEPNAEEPSPPSLVGRDLSRVDGVENWHAPD